MSPGIPRHDAARVPGLDLSGVDRVVLLVTHPAVGVPGEVDAAVRSLVPGVEVRHVDVPPGPPEHERLVAAVVEVVGDRGPATVLVAPWEQDDPAHRHAARAAAAAAWRTDAALVHHRGGAHRARGQDDLVLGQPGETSPFEALHRAAEDPWQVRTSWYEQRKRALTLASLPRPRYRRVLEVGCSVGELTLALRDRAEEVLALDESAAAVAAARQSVSRAGVDRVRVEQARVPEDFPADPVDLVVLSEVGYFLGPRRWRRTARLAGAAVGARGTVLACHWRHPVHGWPLDAERVHVVLGAELDLPVACHVEDPDFLLTVWSGEAEIHPTP